MVIKKLLHIEKFLIWSNDETLELYGDLRIDKYGYRILEFETELRFEEYQYEDKKLRILNSNVKPQTINDFIYSIEFQKSMWVNKKINTVTLSYDEKIKLATEYLHNKYEIQP